MKICMVSDVYYPYVGGIPEHIFHLSQELRRLGHTVKILTSRFGGKTLETLPYCPDEDQVFRVGQGLIIRSNKSFARLPVGWRPMNKVKKFFSQEDFDIIHIHGSLAPTLPIIALRQSRAINLLTFHSDHSKSKGYLVFKPLLLPYFRKLHGRIAVSNAAKESSNRYFPGDYRIIPNGIDTETFNPQVQPLAQYENYSPKILFLGRLEPRKGFKYLLKALPLVKEKFPNLLLIVVGAGLFGYSYKEYVTEEVQANVHFVGLIENEARPAYYATCDVFCAPSIGYESFGIVLLEAMATGKPVVASDISGYRTILEEGREGLFAPPRDPQGIANALIKILSNRELQQKMGEAGRIKALKFSWKSIARQVEDYYQELLEKSSQ